MSEGGAAPPPQVFVVDSQASYVSMPSGKKSAWATAGQKFLLLLLGLALLGVFVEGYLIYILYQRTEPLSRCGTNPPCHNSSNPLISEHQARRMSSHEAESNEIHQITPPGRAIRPFAHLFGAGKSFRTDNVVQWNSDFKEDIKNMDYKNSSLIILQEGYYYIYSKLEIDFSNETTNIAVFHKIMRKTRSYGNPIELLNSKSTCCQHRGSANSDEEIRSSFLAGIFHLQENDQIYVTLSRIKKLIPGTSENCLGAFMINP